MFSDTVFLNVCRNKSIRLANTRNAVGISQTSSNTNQIPENTSVAYFQIDGPGQQDSGAPPQSQYEIQPYEVCKITHQQTDESHYYVTPNSAVEQRKDTFYVNEAEKRIASCPEYTNEVCPVAGTATEYVNNTSDLKNARHDYDDVL